MQIAEGGEMERKNHKPLTTLVKPPSDVRKAGYTTKPRGGGRRRDVDAWGSDPRHRPETAPPRRPNPPRGPRVGPDKRPRARGMEGAHPEHGAQVTGASGPELHSVQRPGGKKGNMTYLLGFHYRSSGGARGFDVGVRRRGRGRSSVAYNKEHFLQANCQFVVRDDCDYTKHCDDPDLLVDWDKIEQVWVLFQRFFVSPAPRCPICLYPPVCARITRCAHIYCARCVLHYLSMAEGCTWRSCPICQEAVHEKDLKSVQTIDAPAQTLGSQLTMRLMKRERGSTYAMPVTDWTERGLHLHNVDDAVDTRVCKLLLATRDQTAAMLQRERRELQVQLEGETDSLEITYIQKAMAILEERWALLYEQRTLSLSESSGDLESVTSDTAQHNNIPGLHLETDIHYEDAFEEDVKDIPCEDILDRADNTSPEAASDASDDTAVTEDTDLTDQPEEEDTRPTQAASGNKNSSCIYYYQAADGQHLYLHPVNARCLVREYGSLEQAPLTITGELLDLETRSMTHELRSRLRYLSHLPVTCQFRVAELRLQPPLVSSRTLREFARELEARVRMRRERAREEQRHSRRVERHEREEARKLGILREVASISRSEMFEGAPAVDEVADPPVTMTTEPSPPSSAVVAWSDTPSFAQMLRTGAKKATAIPNQGQGARVDDLRAQTPDSDEESAPVPTYQETFGDAIQQALETLRLPDESGETKNGKGKKKKKQTLLFATNMSRSK